jgi:endosialidase-like protein
MKRLTSSFTWAVFASLTVALTLSVVPVQAQTPGALCEFDATGICEVDSPIFDSGGNIGIGTTNPFRLLTIGPSFDAAFTIEPSDVSPNAGYIRFGDQTGWKLHIGRSREFSGGPLNTGTTGVLMTIQDNGNIGIGTSFPASKLQVETGDETHPGIQAVSAGGRPLNPGLTVVGSALTTGYLCVSFLDFDTCNYYAPSYSLRVGAFPRNGKGISFGWDEYSSRRWKTNIQTIQGALEKVERLRGVSFNWKEGGKHDIGLIAEEVGEVVPEVVTYDENSTDAVALDYARLTALLIEAVRGQQAQIRELQTELEGRKALEKNRTTLKLKEKDSEGADLKADSLDLKARLEALERLVKQALTASKGSME